MTLCSKGRLASDAPLGRDLLLAFDHEERPTRYAIGSRRQGAWQSTEAILTATFQWIDARGATLGEPSRWWELPK